MDRRQQKTRNAIFEALGALLTVKNYSKITVQDIIDRANVGRTTFYAHFETKDDLFKEMCMDLFQHVFSDTLASERTHDFSMVTGSPQILVTHILYHLIDNQKNIIGILTCDSSELFLRCFRNFFEKLITGHILFNVNLSDSKVPDDFLINHISSSFIGMVEWWINHQLAETPETLAEYFMAVIMPVLQ